jgi:hypothetical protein
MRPEYELDYSGAKPNRFAAHMKRPVVAVVLEPDVASVFDSAAKVNAQLRSVMSVPPPAETTIASARASPQGGLTATEATALEK